MTTGRERVQRVQPEPPAPPSYARRRACARLQPGQLDALDTPFLDALDTLDDYRP